MLFKTVFEYIQSQALVNILEKDFAHVVAFGNDNCILRT